MKMTLKMWFEDIDLVLDFNGHHGINGLTAVVNAAALPSGERKQCGRMRGILT